MKETGRRRRLLAAGAALLLLLAIDFAQPARRQVSARLLLAGIDLYQATLSPVLGKTGARCRFQPTCSHYGEGAIRKHGALVGGWKTMTRIARCGPWTPAGTVDPP